MKRRILGILMAAVMCMAVGCGSKEAPSDGASNAQEPETEETVDAVQEENTTQEEAVVQEETAGEDGQASAWVPEKEITIVVPYEAGGNTDIPTRIFAQYMSKYSEKEVTITNIVGAGGRTGVKEVMSADPDGYTFVLQASGFAMQSALGVADFTYEDLDEVGYFLDSSMAIVVRADSAYETLDDLIEAAKAAPGNIKMGSVSGTLPLFGSLYLEEKNGITFNNVDLDGAAKATELLGSRIETYIDGFGAVKQYIDSGDFRCLAIFSDAAPAGYEDIPTLGQLGYDGYGYLKQNFGIWAPKGTDPAAISYVNNLLKQASEDEECIAALEAISYGVCYTTPQEHTAILEETYAAFVKAAEMIVQ